MTAAILKRPWVALVVHLVVLALALRGCDSCGVEPALVIAANADRSPS